MSQENVKVVRRALDAYNRHDLDEAFREVHRDVELDWSRSTGLEAGIYRGLQASRAFWSTFYETFDQVTNYPEEFVDKGEHVMVVNRTRLVGRDGIEVETHSVQVATIRDGLIVVWRLYKTREEALKAMGLEE